jgi:ribonuclease HI
MTTSKNALESSLKKITLDHAFFVRFFSRMRSLHINLKEMQAMLWVLKTWIHTFAKKKVTLYSDNQVVVNDIKKLFIKDSTMKSLRVIITLLTLHDVLIKTVWISSKKNVLANQLFRAKWNQIANNFLQLQTHIVRSSRSSSDIQI